MIERPISRRNLLKGVGALVGAAVLEGCKFPQPSPTPEPTLEPTPSPSEYSPKAETPTLKQTPQQTPSISPEPSLDMRSPTPSQTFLQSTSVPTEKPPSPPPSPTPKKDNGHVVEKEPKEHNLFNSFLKPFIEESKKLRLKRRTGDPDYLRRIDEVLNTGRVNFAVVSRGITFEPPSEPAEIASMTIYSFNYTHGVFNTITLTHDLRAPEIERKLTERKLIAKGQKNSAQKLDQAILNREVGGFDLTRLVLENATGLSIDFQTVLQDTVIQKIVDKLFGKLEVDIPVPVTLIEYYIGDKKYPGREYRKGKYFLNGSETVGFIKAIPTVGPGNPLYDTRMENAQRQSLVIDYILKAVKGKLSSSGLDDKITFLNNLRILVNDITKTNTEELKYDFDPVVLILNNFGGVIEETVKIILNRQILNTNFPVKGGSPYIVDPACSEDGNESPVHWVDKNHLGRPGEENNDADLKNGVYPAEGSGFEVPFGGNPDGDLIKYWKRVRDYVRKILVTN